MSTFDAPHFQDPDKAREYLENLRWNGEPVCPHCGTIGKAYATSKRGVYRCGSKECRKDFSVTTKSVMESSHIKLHIWLQAFHLMASSKEGMSAHQLHRTLKVTYKTAWFLAHRIREAMRSGGLTPMGGSGKVIEADETYIGRIRGIPKRTGGSHKNMVLTLVERGGSARSFHVDGRAIRDIMPIFRANVARESRMNTDEAKHYYDVKLEYAGHDTVTHTADEYVRYTPDPAYTITTNAVEGYYSIFKRGMKGVYQHCSEKHLHRYLSEFDFRYSYRIALGYNDDMRANLVIKGAENKRLTYRQPRYNGAQI